MNQSPQTKPVLAAAAPFPRWLLPAALAISVALRIALALQGGQYFFGDEGRYDRSLQLYQAIARGDAAGVREIAAQPEHALFVWVGAAVSAGQHLLAQLTAWGDWSNPAHPGFTIGIAAAILSLFSALNLFLLHRVARAAGADEEEAGWSLLLMAAANTAFYFSRHLLPYEVAISAALAGLWVGLGRPTATRALGCGLLGGLTYHLYNGYWFVAPLIWLAHLAAHRGHAQRRRLAFACAAGTAAALAGPILVGALAGGARYFEVMTAFSRSVTQGLFAEGWSLPWEYFWHSEGVYGIAVFTLVALALVKAGHSGPPIPGRIRATLAAIAAAYLLLVLASVGFNRFVVYARTVKPLVPLLCLLGGWSLARTLAPRPRLRPVALAVIAAAAALHFGPHFTLVFPREAELAVLRNWGNPKRSLSVTGSIYVPLALPVSRPDLALVNAQLLYPVRGYHGFPAGQDILTLSHALTYRPFQYESHTPRERALLRNHDISIRLIKLAAPATVPDDLPPPLRYRTEDRPTGR